jgi:predicted NAD/FAD-binding protein
MLADIRRFYRDAQAMSIDDSALSLAEWVERRGYGAGFVEDHLLPMCAALWSQPQQSVRGSAIGHVVAFMRNHGMLGLDRRPDWRGITGGSQRYVSAFARRFRGTLETNAPVQRIRRDARGVEIATDGATQRFDAVVLACHADQCLAMLETPHESERDVLGAIRFQSNRVVVHTDDSLMPHRRRAWSSWNALVGADAERRCTVTYWMNRLQRIATPRPVFVTLNPGDRVGDAHVLATRDYAHPLFDSAAVGAQARLADLQGRRGVYFAGAWFGFGFHEDGFVSGRVAAAAVRRDLGAGLHSEKWRDHVA